MASPGSWLKQCNQTQVAAHWFLEYKESKFWKVNFSSNGIQNLTFREDSLDFLQMKFKLQRRYFKGSVHQEGPWGHMICNFKNGVECWIEPISKRKAILVRNKSPETLKPSISTHFFKIVRKTPLNWFLFINKSIWPFNGKKCVSNINNNLILLFLKSYISSKNKYLWKTLYILES